MQRRPILTLPLAVLVWLNAHGALAARPSLDFLGVYDATGDDARSHELEERIGDALKDMRGWRAWMPADLDESSFGREARLQLLASRSPARRIVEHRRVLGDYALFVTVRPDDRSMDGPLLTTVRLLRVGDGGELFARQYDQFDDDTLKGVVEDLDTLLDPKNGKPTAETALSHGTRLVHAPLRRAGANAPTVISAEADGPGDVIASAIYRREEDAGWHVVDLIHEGRHRYVGALPPMPAGHVLYYVHVTDAELNELVSSGTQDQPHRLLLANPLPPLKSSGQAELPAAALKAPATTDNPARSYAIAKWVTFGTALALAGAGTGLGFSTHVLYVHPITEAQGASAKSYRIPVGCLLGGAGALAVISFGLWRLQVAATPEGPAVAATGSF